MVRIRLRRTGKKKQPSYRVVVADKESPRDGRFIEIIGHYNPRTEPPTVSIKADRALYWLSEGAQPSDAVLRMLKKTGVWQEFKGIEFEPEPEPPAEVSDAEAQAMEATAAQAPDAAAEDQAGEPEAVEAEDA
jgi:small subunit ribosomal protein S16